MFKKYLIGQFFGFNIRADFSFLVLCVFLLWTFAKTVFPVLIPGLSADYYWLLSMYAFIGVLVSILAHELAHAIVAQAFKIRIRSISLFIFGGVAELDGLPTSAKGEYLMALAGPAMSFLMGLFFYSLADLVAIALQIDLSIIVLTFLAKLNILLALFNMIPAFPLDGGRALRGFLWGLKGDFVAATRTAGELGAFFGYMMIAYAAFEVTEFDYMSAIWWALLGIFLHLACNYALRHAESHAILAGQRIDRFMRDHMKTVGANLTLHSLMKDFYFTHFYKSYPVALKDKVLGIVHLKDVMKVPQNQWKKIKVSDIMQPAEHCIFAKPNMEAGKALDLMTDYSLSTLFILDGEKIKGVVSRRDLNDYLATVLSLDYKKLEFE